MTGADPDAGAAPAPPDPVSRTALLVGLIVPFVTVLGVVLLVPASAGQFLGISATSWCLFACAPLTSLCLGASLWSLGRSRGAR